MPIKIIDLANEPAPSSDDLIIIRDNATGTTRKITLATLFANPPIGPNAITNDMLGLEIIEDYNVADSAKAGARLTSQASPSTLTPDVTEYNIFAVSSLAGAMTVAAPNSTPVDGFGILFRIKDNGTARALTWDTIYRSVGVTMPTATVANKMLYVSARYNAPAVKWDVLSIGREA